MNQLSYAIGFLMDPFATLNLATDTSLLCMDELLVRGHRVFWLEQADLDLVSGVLLGRLQEVLATAPLQLAAAEFAGLDFLDALLIRKDPPFDASYLHLTYLLDFLPGKVRCLNSPAALRNINEKLATLRWPTVAPETLVTLDAGRLEAFVRVHGRVVVKPLDECSGRGILFFSQASPTLRQDLEAALLLPSGAPRYMLAQRYLPAVAAGDKRVYMLSAEPVGWVNRVPAPGKDLANIHQGASCEATTLTSSERTICAAVGQWLVTQDVLLAGLDFIGGLLTEVNVTSPSAVRQINAVNGVHLEQQLVDGILKSILRSR